MNRIFRLLRMSAGCIIFISCNSHKTNFNPDDAEVLHHNENQLTEIIIYDIFSPPVTSHIYAYTSLAQYEAVRYMKPDAPSFANKLNGFPALPVPDKSRQYNFILAAAEASVSRLYGGIHYRNSLDVGLAKGRVVGNNVIKKLLLQ